MIIEVQYKMNHCLKRQRKNSISKIPKYGKNKHNSILKQLLYIIHIYNLIGIHKH